MQRPMLSLIALLLANSALAAPVPESLFGGMRWRQVGPFRGGRALTAVGIPGDASTYYFGAASGGVWKSTSGGWQWVPVFDKQSTASIGAVAVAPSDPNILYVGTGEGCLRGNVSSGEGVYKSLDGGASWTNIGLRDSRQIAALAIHPRNPDIAFVAALGHAFGPNDERGLFRTLDGGKSWQKVLSKDRDTGAAEVVMDPSNPNILYAALYQVRRGPHFFSSGGPGSGLYKSIDGGTTWKHLEGNGLPKGLLGRIGISVSAADPSRVYALIEAEKGGMYRSDDAGEHWELVNDDDRFRQRAWYFSHVFADPRSVDTVYTANTGLFRSTDGGKSWQLLQAPHGDHHDLWIDPTNPKRMINANDGGVTLSLDGGKTWSPQNNQPTAQFYHVSTDNDFPYRILGAQQDNSNLAVLSYSDAGVIDWSDFSFAGGGESGYVAAHPKDPDIIYSTDNTGVVVVYDRKTKSTKDIAVVPLDLSGHGAKDHPHRFAWTEPIFVSGHNPDVVYYAGDAVFKSADSGQTWTQISPDLTRNDPSRQEPSGGPITKDNAGAETYDTVFTLAESPLDKNVLWAGSDDGLIHLTRDGGAHWENVTPGEVPEWSLVSMIEASPFAAGTAYAAIERHKLDDLRPLIFKSDDYGKHWKKITGGLPANAFVRAVREDPKRKGLFYAATEAGVFVSFDSGGEWQPLQLNLPPVPVHDLAIKDADLIAATHGRAFWVLDDLEPLRQVSRKSAGEELILYRPRPQARLHISQLQSKGRPLGDNPPKGAIIDYYLKAEPKGDVLLEIADPKGTLIRRYTSAEEKKFEQPPEWPDQAVAPERIPAKAGHNRFPWDLNMQAPTEIPGAFYSGTPPTGALVIPGHYQVRLIANGKTLTAPLEITPDPRVRARPADLKAQLDLAVKVRERLGALHAAVNQIRDLRAQFALLEKRLAADSSNAALKASVEQIAARMHPVEERLLQVKLRSSEGTLNFPTMLNEQLYWLMNLIDGADGPPTAAEIAEAERLGKEVEAEVAKWKGIAEKDVAALNELIKKAPVPAVHILPAADKATGSDVAGQKQ